MEGGDGYCVEEFPYPDSLVAASGWIDDDVERRITKPSQAFGTLRKAIYLWIRT